MAVADGSPVAVAVGVGVRVGVSDAVEVAVGDGVGEGAVNPTPISFTFCGLPAAASVNFSRPFLNLPVDGGVKLTETGQVPAGGIALVHPLESRLKPVPVTLTEGTDNSRLLLLLRVTLCGLLRTPAGTLPKLIFLGDSPTASLFLVAEVLV